MSYSLRDYKRVGHDLATKQQRCLKDMESGVKRIVQIHTVSIEQKFLDLYPFSLHHLVSPIFLSPVRSYCPSPVAPLTIDGRTADFVIFLSEKASGGRPEAAGALVGLPPRLSADGRIADGDGSLLCKCQPRGELLPLCFWSQILLEDFSDFCGHWLFMRQPLGGAKVRTE